MFTWDHLIDVAEEMVFCSNKSIDNEAYYRSAINRAYYGAHKSTHKLIEEEFSFIEGKSQTDPGIHTQVINALRNHPNMHLKRAYWKLEALRKQRVDADYEYLPTGNNTSEQNALLAIRHARDICGLLKSAGS